MDLYNALNSSDILSITTNFGPRWRQPTQILDPRIMQFSGQADLLKETDMTRSYGFLLQCLLTAAVLLVARLGGGADARAADRR